MSLTSLQIALVDLARCWPGPKLVMEWPGKFFVVEGRVYGEPAIRRYARRYQPLSLSDLDAVDPGQSTIDVLTVWGEEIWHPDIGQWTLWAERPKEHVSDLLSAMFAVYRDYDIRWDHRLFWPTVLATMIAEEAARQ